MALYGYQALSKDGKKTRGSLDAASEYAVREHLIKLGLYPVTIHLLSHMERISLWQRIISRSVSNKDKILLTKQLAVLLKSGIPLLQALELLTDQFTGQLKHILITIKDGIKEGQSLADGLKQFPSTFDTTYIQLVRAGEATGRLQIILERLVQYLERRQEIVKRVKSALTYPLIQASVVLLVVIVLLYSVVPKFAATFSSKGAQLPWTTQFLLSLSNFITGHYILLMGGLIALMSLYKLWSSTGSGRRIIDQINLRIPIVSYFTRTGSIVQFCRTLGMLMESGVNLAEALDIVVQITDNQILKDALSTARDKIIKEGKISEYLKQTGIFPPIAIYLLKTGEHSGELDTMLLTIAQDYEADLTEYSDRLSTLLEPLTLLVMAVVVGFIVFAIAQPMMQQTQLIKL
jgi:type II secretory pathway component PulF